MTAGAVRSERRGPRGWAWPVGLMLVALGFGYAWVSRVSGVAVDTAHLVRTRLNTDLIGFTNGESPASILIPAGSVVTLKRVHPDATFEYSYTFVSSFPLADYGVDVPDGPREWMDSMAPKSEAGSSGVDPHGERR